jgi:hypothetical protein
MAAKRFVHLRYRRVVLAGVMGAVSALSTGEAASGQTPAPTLQTDRACYTPGEQILVSGANYTPGAGAAMILSLEGDRILPMGSLTAGATGALSGDLRAPQLGVRNVLEEKATLTATDQASGFTRPPGVAQFTLSAWGVTVDDPRWWNRRIADPRRRSTFRFIGFAPATRGWVHYRHGGRTVKTIPMGALQGPCGGLSKRMRQFPFRPVPAGQWKLMFSGAPAFDPSGAYIGVSVRVPRDKAVD